MDGCTGKKHVIQLVSDEIWRTLTRVSVIS